MNNTPNSVRKEAQRQYDRIPEILRKNAPFCLWRYEVKDGRTTKVPYRVTGIRANPTDISTFSTFDKVLAVADQYDGIGTVPNKYLSAIDIDDCVIDGKLSDMAQDIVDTMKTYTEFSPSGTGLRILFTAKDSGYDKGRYYINNRKIGLEVYMADFSEQFISLTGNVLCGDNIEERPKEVIAVLDKYMVRPSTAKSHVEAPGSYLTDESVIGKAKVSKQGEKFTALWVGSTDGYISHSEADLALCTMLAFWCGGDTEQMDRLFRTSGLYRDKWEREDYRNNTLEKAVDATSEFYAPVSISAADDFNDLAQTLLALDPAQNSRYKGGDIGFGRLYADVYKDIARYVPERKKWYIFNGQRWVADAGSLMAMELCKDLADALIVYALSVKDEGVRGVFLDQCRKWQRRRFRDIYLKDAQSVYPIPMAAFDSDRYLLNCNNGTLDLRSKTFYPHNPDDLLTKICAVDYIPSAHSQRFDAFIDEIMSHDKEKARFLQKSLGYGISGDTRYECLFLLYGELTRNGKGTLMESCLTAVGDYGRTVRPETIAQKQNANSQAPSEDLARLAGIRFANISEPSRGLVLNAAQVKSMTGNDSINARYLHENSFDFKPQFKLYINTNYLPVISDMTLFSSGRVVIIPFDRHFEEWEQDKGLKEEFSKPEVQSAILNWLVEGYYLLQAEGLSQPRAVTEAIRAYSYESDKIAQFAEERLEEDANAETRTSEVYSSYRQWCADNGCYAENNRNFNHELRKFATVVRRRPRKGGEKTTLLVGYKLKPGVEFL